MKNFRVLRGMLVICFIFFAGLFSPTAHASTIKPVNWCEVSVMQMDRVVVTKVPARVYPSFAISVNDVAYKTHSRFLQYEKQL